MTLGSSASRFPARENRTRQRIGPAGSIANQMRGTSGELTAEQKRDRVARYRRVRGRATRWLLDQMNPDGSIGDVSEGYFFYRGPWTFSLVGETGAASRLCGWIRKHMLQPDGRIGGPCRKLNDAWAYRDSALIVGAQMAGQYDLSHGLMPALLRWQDPASGAFANDRRENGSKSDDQSIPYTAGGGFACLATGNLEAARSVASFLQRIYDAQDELPDRFYYDWSRARQATNREFPPDRAFWFVVENRVARLQRWTVGGIAAGFLCRLFLADPDPNYLELARRYQDFSMAATDGQFRYDPVCKSGWGSSLLYLITGDPRYEAWTYRMGDWFVRQQHRDGYWPPTDGESTRGRLIHNALEFTMHVDTIISGLSSRPPST